MIKVQFENGAVDVQEGGENDLKEAVQRASQKTGLPLHKVDKISYPDRVHEGGGDAYLAGSPLVDFINNIVDEISEQILVEALERYADPENWGNVFNRHHHVPVRWVGGGNGSDVARQALAKYRGEALNE